ncbi:hypothetical protein ACFOY2_06715 [Nonomuraea purpurea]|uniref:Uncharacterized protein n=1 Tax=Nonomuraea purpurea TaxID=1849276 RepID=A0ABV8G1C5_9ACTN
MKRLIPALLPALAACGAQPAPNAQAAALTWAIETQPITMNPQLWSQNKVTGAWLHAAA